MPRLAILLAALALPVAARAQALYNDGATLSIGAGTTVYVRGDLLNASGSILTNAGTLRVSGNTTTNAAVSSAGGTLVLEGSSAQTLGGTADYATTNAVVNNAAGLTLATRLRVDGAMTFTSGIVTAASASDPVAFTATGTVSGTPTDASHVRGYVVKEGTGSFTYPLGDGTRYQPTATALTANSAGLSARYVPADAGAAPFTAGGTEATLLRAYNQFEYWDLAPVGTATGSVTIFFDTYKNLGITAVAGLRVAHQSATAWLNEGAAASSGTAAAGSVTSNAVSTWSPFALGSISSTNPLPVELLAFTATRQGEAARLVWATASEKNSAYFEAETSLDGTAFRAVGRVTAQGNTAQRHDYELRDPRLLAYGTPVVYYRLRQVDLDGTVNYSPVRALTVGDGATGAALVLFPNPARGRVQWTGLAEAPAHLLDLAGRRVRTAPAGALALDLAGVPAGVYLLRSGAQSARLAVE